MLVRALPSVRRTSDRPVEHCGLPFEPLPTRHGRNDIDAVADSAVVSAAISVMPEPMKRLVDRLAGAGVAAAGRELGRLLEMAVR